jgi:Fe-S-cluster containining protein
MVKLTVAEAMVIYSYLVEINQWGNVRDEIKSQLSTSKNIDPVAWFKMRIECPILDKTTKKCKAYPVRPIFCSTHFVTSDSKACDPWYTGNKPYKPEPMGELYDLTMKRIND